MNCSPADLHRARTAAERGCRHLVPSHEDAEDCASEAITWALSHPESLQGVANVEGWLVTVARRKAIDLAREAGRQRRCEGQLQAWERQPQHDHAEDVADRAEAAWVAGRAQAALPHRTYSVMSALSHGASVGEAADSLRLSPRAVESHLLRARRRMRSIMTIASAAVGLLIGAGRRTAPVGAPLVAVALSVALLVDSAPGDGWSEGTGDGSRRALPTASADDPGLAGLTRPVAPIAVRQHEKRTTAPERPESSPVAMVGTPVGPVKVESEDRGGETGPVAAVMGCLEGLTISPERIGC